MLHTHDDHAPRPRVRASHLFIDLLEHLDVRFARLEIMLPGGSELEPLNGAVEQGKSEIALERTDELGNCGGGHVESTRRAGKTGLFGRGYEVAKRSEPIHENEYKPKVNEDVNPQDIPLAVSSAVQLAQTEDAERQ